MKLTGPLFLAASLACLAVGPARAQTAPAPAPPPPPYGPSITLEQAHTVLAAAQAEAKRRGVPVTVAVVDSGGYIVLVERMNGASLASSETVFLKAKSAVVWQRSTSTWLAAIEASHGAQTTFPDLYAGNGGEIIVSGGKIVGGVGVGGSAPNEGDIAKIAAAALK
jgi:uncharacterized protein GlcG (DUF336 family)